MLSDPCYRLFIHDVVCDNLLTPANSNICKFPRINHGLDCFTSSCIFTRGVVAM